VDSYLTRGAPRRSKVASSLLELAESMEVVAAQFRSIDDLTLDELRRTARNSLELPIDRIVQEADTINLPEPGKHDRGSSIWVRRLNSMAYIARLSHRAYTLGSNVVDKGGNTNAYSASTGSPRCALVNRGWYVFDFFKPGRATGSVEGPFHVFLDAVYEYATGLSSEDHDLTHWIKRLCRVNNRSKVLTQRFEELELERRNLPRKPKPSRRLRQIWAELDEISDEQLALLRRAPPFI
jgi:hypothetical protein